MFWWFHIGLLVSSWEEQIYESSVKVTTTIGQHTEKVMAHQEASTNIMLMSSSVRERKITTKRAVATFPVLQGKENRREMRIHVTAFFTPIKRWNVN